MLRHFIAAWLLYWAAVALLPVHSIYPATGLAFLLQAVFVLLVMVGYAVVAVSLGASRVPDVGRSDIPSAPRLIRLALLASLLGLAALTYDKVVVQGVDYSESIAAAREQWRRLGEEREGQASSPFSMLGYLLGSGYYVVVVLAITQGRVLSVRQRIGALLASFALLMANAAITGGRSGILLMAAVVLAAMAARRRRGSPLFSTPQQRHFAKALSALAFLYVLFVFFERADTGDLEALDYALDFLPFLGVEADAWYRTLLDGSAFGSLSAMLVLAISYVTHSFATVAAIIDGPIEDKTMMFAHASGILHKLGLMPAPDGEWFLVGRFASVPGALWHQFGGVGFVVGSLLHGMIGAGVLAWTQRRPRRLLPLGAFVMTYVVLLLSPAVFAADFLSYPFVLGAFVMLAALTRPARAAPRLSAGAPARAA